MEVSWAGYLLAKNTQDLRVAGMSISRNSWKWNFFIRSEDLYIPVSATYAVKIHYSSDTNHTLRVVSGNFIDGSFASR